MWTNTVGHTSSWEQFLAKASVDPTKPADLEKLADAVMDAIKEGVPKEVFEPDHVPYNMDLVKQLAILPKLPLVDDEFVMSYSTFGDMDKDTGELLYCIACMSNQTGQVRAMDTTCGVPTVADCEAVLFAAMLQPTPCAGDPLRPTSVLIAHRWGQQALERLQPFLGEYEIGVRFQTEEDAQYSARMQGVNPMGFNV